MYTTEACSRFAMRDRKSRAPSKKACGPLSTRFLKKVRRTSKHIRFCVSSSELKKLLNRQHAGITTQASNQRINTY